MLTAIPNDIFRYARDPSERDFLRMTSGWRVDENQPFTIIGRILTLVNSAC